MKEWTQLNWKRNKNLKKGGAKGIQPHPVHAAAAAFIIFSNSLLIIESLISHTEHEEKILNV